MHYLFSFSSWLFCLRERRPLQWRNNSHKHHAGGLCQSVPGETKPWPNTYVKNRVAVLSNWEIFRLTIGAEWRSGTYELSVTMAGPRAGSRTRSPAGASGTRGTGSWSSQSVLHHATKLTVRARLDFFRKKTCDIIHMTGCFTNTSVRWHYQGPISQSSTIVTIVTIVTMAEKTAFYQKMQVIKCLYNWKLQPFGSKLMSILYFGTISGWNCC